MALLEYPVERFLISEGSVGRYLISGRYITPSKAVIYFNLRYSNQLINGYDDFVVLSESVQRNGEETTISGAEWKGFYTLLSRHVFTYSHVKLFDLHFMNIVHDYLHHECGYLRSMYPRNIKQVKITMDRNPDFWISNFELVIDDVTYREYKESGERYRAQLQKVSISVAYIAWV